MSRHRAFAHRLRAFTDPFFEFMYPLHCRSCGHRIAREDVLCPECMNDLTEFVDVMKFQPEKG
jgi:predicted Zn-ribbon and HTH transcriptional regulator